MPGRRSLVQAQVNLQKKFPVGRMDSYGSGKVNSLNSLIINRIVNTSFCSSDATSNETLINDLFRPPIEYLLVEIVVAIIAFAGNLLAIIVFVLDKRLRKVTNFYIFSLSVADLLVGLVGVPSAILTKMGLPRNAFYACLTMLSVLVVFCTISILNLVAVSLDRFWAILYPLNYHSRMSSSAARLVIISCWILGSLVGFLPIFGWNKGDNLKEHHGRCYFLSIMDYNFLVFIFFATILFPALLMLFAYLRIYLVVVHHSFPFDGRDSYKNDSYKSCSDKPVSSIESSEESDFRLSESKVFSYNRREVKKARKLAMIVVFFMICWIPLYLNNTVEAFFSFHSPLWLVDAFIVLSHLNSAINPILYAYHMKDFREAMKSLICGCFMKQSSQARANSKSQELRSFYPQRFSGLAKAAWESNNTHSSGQVNGRY